MSKEMVIKWEGRKQNDGMRGQKESVREYRDWRKGLEMKAAGIDK